MIDIEKTVREFMQELQGGSVTSHTSITNVVDVCDDLCRKLEHSLLVLGLTQEELLKECRMARTVQVGTVCVAPYYVADASEMLAGSSVEVCAAVGFPSAYMSTEAKLADVRACVIDGASEIDLAINVAAVKSGDMKKAESDFRSAVDAVAERAIVKAVFEHAAYDAREKEDVLQMIERSGAPFLKIQNMVSGHGARVEDIIFVKSILGDKVKIKIDGGVKTLAQAVELFSAGAHRIGLTATEAIAEEISKSRR